MGTDELKQKKPVDINIWDLLGAVLNKLWLIILVCLLAVIAAYLYTRYMITPLYQSTASVYVLSKSGETIEYSDLTLSKGLAADYEVLITSRAVLEKVITDLNLNVSYEYLKANTSVGNPSDTRVLEITVRNKDPQTAKHITDAICSTASEKIVEIMGAEQVNTIDSGNIPVNPININYSKNIILAVLFAMIICLIIIFLVYILDDKIKTPEDVEKYLELSTLGILPYNDKLTNKQKIK